MQSTAFYCHTLMIIILKRQVDIMHSEYVTALVKKRVINQMHTSSDH